MIESEVHRMCMQNLSSLSKIGNVTVCKGLRHIWFGHDLPGKLYLPVQPIGTRATT